MKTLRKSSLITVIILSAWLWTTFSYSMQVKCCCFPQNKCRCSEKKQSEQSSPRHKNHQEVNHHHQKDNHYHPEDNYHQGENQCHQEDNDCSCTKCGISDTQEAALKIYLTEKEKKQVLALGQDILERKIPLPKNIVTYQERKPTTKFLSLFLINSSFLL